MSSFVQAAWPQAKARVQASVNGLFCLFCFKAHEGMMAKAVGTSSFQSCVYQSRQTDHFPSKINYPDMKAGSQLKWRNRDSSSMWLSYTPSASPRMPRDIESHFCLWSSPILDDSNSIVFTSNSRASFLEVYLLQFVTFL